MQNKIYVHPKCSTCKKALDFLKQHQIDVAVIDILENPPSVDDLMKALIQEKKLTKILNTSGKLYQAIESKEAFFALDPIEILKSMNKSPMLIKRPFFVSDKGLLVGFNTGEWNRFFSK